MDAPTVRYATTTDGVRIAYGVAGEGEPLLYCRCPAGPPFTTVVGMDELDPWFGELARRHRLITFDFRAGGLSQRGDRPLSPETLSLDLAAVLDDLGIESAVLQTELMASAPAIRLAATQPERVRQLVMWHPMIAQSQRSRDPKLAARWEAFFETARDDWEMFCIRLIRESYEVPERVARSIAGAWARHARAEDFSEAWDPRGTGSAEPLLGQLHAPALILQRARDGYYRLTLDGAETAAAIPGARLQIVPGRDNFPYTDHPDAIIAEIERFLRDAQDGTVAEPKMRPASGASAQAAQDADPGTLSPREIEVVQLVSQGLRNPEIAARLGVERSTVASHVHNALAKTNLSNRIQLTGYAYRTGLARPDSSEQ